MNEIWKPIPLAGFIGYEASSKGRIRTTITRCVSFGNNTRTIEPKILNCSSINNSGYKTFTASNNRINKRFLVHRCVALAFHENTNNNPVVNHIDGNKLNNNSNNLEWATHKENFSHAVNTGLLKLPEKRNSYVIEYNDGSKETIIGWDAVCKVLNIKSMGFTNKFYTHKRNSNILIYHKEYESFIDYLRHTNNFVIGKNKIIKCIKQSGDVIEYKSLKDAKLHNKNISSDLLNKLPNKYGDLWLYKEIDIYKLFENFENKS